MARLIGLAFLPFARTSASASATSSLSLFVAWVRAAGLRLMSSVTCSRHLNDWRRSEVVASRSRHLMVPVSAGYPRAPHGSSDCVPTVAGGGVGHRRGCSWRRSRPGRAMRRTPGTPTRARPSAHVSRDILPRLMRVGGFLLKNPNGFSIDRLSPHALWFARCFTSRAARGFFWLRPGCSGRRSRPGRA